MTFNVVMGNPPYQDKQEADSKRGGGDSLWDKFVMKAMDALKKSGCLVFVHPAGWRKPKGSFVDARKALLNNNHMIHLSIHNASDGQKIFGAGTRYDWYVVQKGSSGLTTIEGEEGVVVEKNLDDFEFIPNSHFDLFEKMLAKEGEAKVEVLYSASAYEHRKSWMSYEKTEAFKYPVMHCIRKSDDNYIIWSSRNDKGHFGIPKVIFGRGSSKKILIDAKGEYGLSEDTRGIIANEDELETIAKVLESESFQNFMMSCEIAAGIPDPFNKNAIELFRKDFWKEFTT